MISSAITCASENIDYDQFIGPLAYSNSMKRSKSNIAAGLWIYLILVLFLSI